VSQASCPIPQSGVKVEYRGFTASQFTRSANELLSPVSPGTCHILFIIDQLKKPFGGAEQILLKMTRNLPREKFRCSVLTFATDLTTDELSSFPCPLYVFPLTCSYDLNAARMAIRLTRLVHSENVQIVHSFFETSDLWGGTIVRLTSKAKLVSSRRDMGILRSAKHRLGYRVLGRLAHKVLTVSEEVRQFVLATDHLSPDKVITLRNGLESLDPIALEPSAAVRKRLGFAATDRLITTVGNIRRVKGFDVLIQAAAEVCGCIPQASFVVAGGVSDQAYYNELLRMVEAHGLGDRFKFIGHQPVIFPLLYASDLFVLPSRSEGFSNALLEAMTSGLACIATRVGGNPEAIRDGETGLLVEPEDSHLMAHRICQLLQDRQHAKELGSAARRRVADNFSLTAMVEKLVGVYESVLSI
jgi:glycosyltransferase involved in cell wall biosynthesis